MNFLQALGLGMLCFGGSSYPTSTPYWAQIQTAYPSDLYALDLDNHYLDLATSSAWAYQSSTRGGYQMPMVTNYSTSYPPIFNYDYASNPYMQQPRTGWQADGSYICADGTRLLPHSATSNDEEDDGVEIEAEDQEAFDAMKTFIEECITAYKKIDRKKAKEMADSLRNIGELEEYESFEDAEFDLKALIAKFPEEIIESVLNKKSKAEYALRDSEMEVSNAIIAAFEKNNAKAIQNAFKQLNEDNIVMVFDSLDLNVLEVLKNTPSDVLSDDQKMEILVDIAENFNKVAEEYDITTVNTQESDMDKLIASIQKVYEAIRTKIAEEVDFEVKDAYSNMFSEHTATIDVTGATSECNEDIADEKAETEIEVDGVVVDGDEMVQTQINPETDETVNVTEVDHDGNTYQKTTVYNEKREVELIKVQDTDGINFKWRPDKAAKVIGLRSLVVYIDGCQYKIYIDDKKKQCYEWHREKDRNKCGFKPIDTPPGVKFIVEE